MLDLILPKLILRFGVENVSKVRKEIFLVDHKFYPVVKRDQR